MKITALFATASLALAMMASSAHAQTAPTYVAPTNLSGPGAPLMKGLQNDPRGAQIALADLIARSLAQDSTGNRLLNPAACRDNGSCATPNTYFVAITTWHPRSGITSVAELPKYIVGLKNVLTDGRFLSARMLGRQLDLSSGFSRTLAKGEFAWQDTQTGEIILLENCGNVAKEMDDVAEVSVQDNCVTVAMRRPAGTERVGWEVTPDHLGSRCWGILQDGNIKTEMTDQCPKKNCNFTSANAFLVKFDEAHGVHTIIGNEPRIGSYTPVINDREAVDVFKVPSLIKKGGSINFCITVRQPDGTLVTYKVKHLAFRETDKGHEFATNSPWTLVDDAF
jgi:hypothetical protein